MLLTAAGGAVLGYLAVLKMMGESIGTRPLLGLGFILSVAGLQFLTTGVLAELLVRVYFDGTHARPYHGWPMAALERDEGWHV
jgi:hypothetical protein